nr:hypothetical protein [uncultured Hyphomonas sp.]
MRISRTSDQEHLFSQHDWHDIVRASEEAIKKHAVNKTLGDFDTSIDALAEELAQEFTPEPPVLLIDEISVEQKEVQVERARDGYSRRDPFFSGQPDTITRNAVEVTVPVDGDTAMLRIRPPKYNMSPPRAKISRDSISFIIILDTEDSKEIRSRIDQRVADIEEFLNWQREAAGDLPQRMMSLAKRELEYRHANLGSAHNVVNNLGFKVKKSDD